MCVVQESSRIMKMKALLDEGMIGWLFVLAIVLSGVFALHYYLYTRRYYQLARKIPGPPGWPIIGHTFNFLRGTEEAFHNIWNSVGSSEVCKLWLATRLYTFIRNPADVELVLGSRVHLHKFVESNFFESWLDDGLNVVSGCKWKAYRRLMTPFLQSGQIFEQILTLNKIMENKNLNSSGKELDCYSYMSDAVMELLLVSTFGENIDKDESRQYSQAIQKLRKIIRHRQNKFWLYPDYIFKLSKHAKSQEDLLKIVHHFTRKAVKKRKEALMKQGYGLLKSRNFFEGALKCHNESECLKKPTTVPCILDLMMGVTHNGMALMDTEVQNQVNAIMLEGHDATALTGSIFLGVLADRPDIQEKCVAELNDIFGDSQRPVTFNDISEMKYLERCLMETLRMNPPVPFISRKLEEDLRLASTSLTIPENSIVVIDVRKLQMNEEIYSKPDIFDPHNFIKEKCVSRHYFSFIPFSAGPRNCIEIFETLVKKSYEYEDVIKVWFGPRLFVFLTNPVDIEVLLTSTEHVEKSVEYEFMKPWLGDGLLISSGQKWFAHRKVIAQTFHLNVLRSFLGKFNENAKKLIKSLAAEEGNEFDCRRYMCKYTAETLIDTVMGADKDKLGFESPLYSGATTKLCELVHLRHTKLHFRSDLLFNITKHGFEHKKLVSLVHDFSAKVIQFKKSQRDLLKPSQLIENLDTRKEYKSFTDYEKSTGISYGQSSGLKDDLDNDALGRKKKCAFLDTLLEKEAKKEIFSMKDVQEQIDTLMFEGHDTTAGVSSMFLCLMATHPDVQAKCAEELEKVFGDSDRDVTFEDTYEMKYLERCIMETLRVYSPVPVIARNLKKELTLVTKKITLPISTTVIVAIFKLHRREDLYPNSEKFNPDNFIQEKTAARSFYSFIPFSAGPRSCVGRKYAILKLKVVLSTILRKYIITTSCPLENWKLQADITLKRTDGFKIKLIPRSL